MAANPATDFDLGPLTGVKTEIDHSLAQARENLSWCDGTADLLADLHRRRPAPVPEVLVHGDLSAYNILLGDNGPVIIDLPQAIDPRFNNSARRLFERDVRNVAKFCSRSGARIDADGVIDELWRRFTFSDWGR